MVSIEDIVGIDLPIAMIFSFKNEVDIVVS